MIQVGPKGRVVIPAMIRQKLGIQQGTQLGVGISNGAVLLIPMHEIESRLQNMFRELDVSMSGELLKERRAEANAQVKQK